MLSKARTFKSILELTKTRSLEKQSKVSEWLQFQNLDLPIITASKSWSL